MHDQMWIDGRWQSGDTTDARDVIFGPVLAVIPFSDEAEAVRIANDTPYGLAGAVWTRDVFRGIRVLKQIRARIEAPLHDPARRPTAELGGAIGRALTRKDAVMLELRTDSHVNFNDRLVFANAGVIHGVRRIVVYGSVGRSIQASDGSSHAYAAAGVKMQIDTKHGGR